MAEGNEDPREVDWHPRFAKALMGQDAAASQLRKAFASGRPHHAWLLHGPKGVGKATLAYQFAAQVLGGSDQSRRWIENRAHPDLFVLERQLNDAKPRKLKSEIVVEDARLLVNFFAHTASGNWRVAIIDAADDLNAASANAILKLVEEPPPKALLLLICHEPGRLLRTLKSRCQQLELSKLTDGDISHIINMLPLEDKPESQDLDRAIGLANGSPGQAIALLRSTGAKAFSDFSRFNRPKASELIAISNQFTGRSAGPDEFQIFTGLMLDWVARQATARGSGKLAEAHVTISETARVTQGFNLDRRQAVMAQLQLVNDALKAS